MMAQNPVYIISGAGLMGDSPPKKERELGALNICNFESGDIYDE